MELPHWHSLAVLETCHRVVRPLHEPSPAASPSVRSAERTQIRLDWLGSVAPSAGVASAGPGSDPLLQGLALLGGSGLTRISCDFPSVHIRGPDSDIL